MKKFAAASGTPAKDPWARAYGLPITAIVSCTDKVPRREAWRYTGPFTRRNRFRGMFPGFGIATVAFAAYCGYEYMFLNDNHHGDGGHGHDEQQH